MCQLDGVVALTTVNRPDSSQRRGPSATPGIVILDVAPRVLDLGTSVKRSEICVGRRESHVTYRFPHGPGVKGLEKIFMVVKASQSLSSKTF